MAHPNSLANLKRGNPGHKGGRGRPTDEALKLARDYSPQGIRKLIAMARAKKTPDAVRARCIQLLLDRAMGKPAQQVTLDADVDVNLGGRLVIEPVRDGVDIPE